MSTAPVSVVSSALLPAVVGQVMRQAFLLRFDSLFHPGRALSFPCDEQGRVELDRLGERARNNYFYARAVVGREFATPMVIFDDE